MNAYEQDKTAFLKKHGLKEVFTSPMINDTYHKEYITEDGGIFYEVMSSHYETIETETHGVKVETFVKLFRVEYWNTDNAKSRYHYEKY